MRQQSASNRLSWYISQHLESLTRKGAYHHSEGSTIASGRQVHYLGSTLARVVHIDDEVNTRIAKASAAFGSIWDRSGITLDTKLKGYRSVVLPTLLYACETWKVYQRRAKRL